MILLTGKSSLRQTGILDRVVKNLQENGIEYIVYDHVEPNLRTVTVDEGAWLAKENGVDVVIGIGGGNGAITLQGI